MMAVAVTTVPTFVAGPPRVLFEGRYGATAIVRPYDVSPDGQRFLMVKQKGPGSDLRLADDPRAELARGAESAGATEVAGTLICCSNLS